jgi:A/G-specific adenine glycosylase
LIFSFYKYNRNIHLTDLIFHKYKNNWCKSILITEFYSLYKSQGLTSGVVKIFQDIIYNYYNNKGRKFPFRQDITPYNVLVSEMMLQQTQTGRVAEKFIAFTERFPDFETLSNSTTEEILKSWQGLGYNRRALALKEIARKIVNEYGGKLPNDIQTLKSFPQIGHNTASSIVAFAYNIPTYFIETNIRRVYIYFFFYDKKSVKDKEIMPIVHKTLDISNVRHWYYALMDYGVMLKKTHPELNKRSAHYRKQSQFKGSTRETRGKILKLLMEKKSLRETEIIKILKEDSEKIKKILKTLTKEGFLNEELSIYSLSK